MLIIIPGAQKAGTSRLFGLLTSHPKIQTLSSTHVERIKEPHFFSLRPETAQQNQGWYASLFGGGSYYVDASTSYLMAPQAPKLMKSYVPESRVVVILRDPVARAYSGYLHMASKMPSRDQRDFSAIVNEIYQRYEEIGIQQAENEVLEKGIREGRVDDEYFGPSYLTDRLGAPFESNVQDPLWPYKYFQHSQYSRRLEPYRAIYDSKEMKVIGLEQLSDDTDAVATEIFRFVEVEENYSAPGKTNSTTIPTTFGRLYKSLNDVVEKIPLVREASNSSLLDPLKDLLRDKVM